MKIFSAFFLLIGFLTIEMATTRAETPTEAVDRIWNTWDFSRGEPSTSAPNDIVALNLKIAREQGIAVLAPIMARSKEWKSEEALIFVPVVALLPRKETVIELHRYKKEGTPSERQAAEDFLAEFEMSEVKEMVGKYTKDQKP